VDAHVLRLSFNTQDLVGQVNSGTMTEHVLRSAQVPPEKCDAFGFPYGTRSQLVSYRN
jgi:hypothetical protein